VLDGAFANSRTKAFQFMYKIVLSSNIYKHEMLLDGVHHIMPCCAHVLCYFVFTALSVCCIMLCCGALMPSVSPFFLGLCSALSTMVTSASFHGVVGLTVRTSCGQISSGA